MSVDPRTVRVVFESISSAVEGANLSLTAAFNIADWTAVRRAALAAWHFSEGVARRGLGGDQAATDTQPATHLAAGDGLIRGAIARIGAGQAAMADALVVGDDDAFRRGAHDCYLAADEIISYTDARRETPDCQPIPEEYLAVLRRAPGYGTN